MSDAFTMQLRSKPRLFHWSYLGLSSLVGDIRRYAEDCSTKKGYTALDVGCGLAPYQKYFQGYAKYIRMDHFDAPFIDVKGEIENIPLPDNSVDNILCTQVLEHTNNYQRGVNEAYRVLRPGGKAFFSFPFCSNLHGKDDRWRFSPYTIRQVFNKYAIHSIHSSGGFAISMGQFYCTFLASFPLGRYIFMPIFLLINAVSLFFDAVIKTLLMPPFKLILPKNAYLQMRTNINDSLALNYTVIVEKAADSQS